MDNEPKKECPKPPVKQKLPRDKELKFSKVLKFTSENAPPNNSLSEILNIHLRKKQ